MENNKLIETLHNDIIMIHNNNINDTLIFALKLLHSLTRNINESMYTILKKQVSNIVIDKIYIIFVCSKSNFTMTAIQ